MYIDLRWAPSRRDAEEIYAGVPANVSIHRVALLGLKHLALTVRGGFIIRFTRDVGRLRLSFGVSVSNVETSLSFINSMGRWRIFHAG
ncbi:MAG: hypothetical protein WBW73_04790 [Rhodoplanes sp.]